MGFGLRRLVAPGFCAFALAGCASPPPPSYDLSSATTPLRVGAIAGPLLIDEPDASDILDSDRIVIRQGGDQLAYLGKAQWADRLPRLLRARLTSAFERAKLARSIVSSGMVYDYRLTTEIRRFEVDVSTHEARIEIVARIVAGANGRVLATQTFAARAPAPLTADGAAARALDIAAQDATARILRWTVAAI